jgi:hypothetical protein
LLARLGCRFFHQTVKLIFDQAGFAGESVALGGFVFAAWLRSRITRAACHCAAKERPGAVFRKRKTSLSMLPRRSLMTLYFPRSDAVKALRVAMAWDGVAMAFA